MRFSSLFLALAAAAIVTGCAQPRTAVPVASAQEIDAETRHHHNFLRESRAKGHVVGGENRKSARPRLQKVAKRIAPAAVKLCEDLHMPDPMDCAYSLHLKRGAAEEPNAYTDGEDIYINTPMIRHALTDDELALVIAHEFAHNIMEHHGSLQQNVLLGAMLGAATDAALGGYGGGANSGAELGMLAYSPAFEHEADYVGLYLTARAGYDYKEATELWRRISLTLQDSIYFAYTHPTNPERYVVLRKTVEEINRKKKAKAELLPEFRTQVAATAP